MPVPEEPPQRPVASFQTIRPFGRTNSLADGGLGRTHDLHGRFCSKPFDNFEINPDGSVAVCCHAWLPQKIGNIAEQGLWEVWNSDIAQRIRASILDGSYRYCVAEECGAIQAGTLPKCAEVQDPRHRTYIDQQLTKLDEPPFLFNLGYDESCNLSCPSCRQALVLHTQGPEYEKRARIQRTLVDTLLTEPHDHPMRLNITFSGDPLGSKLFRDLLVNLDGRKFPGLEVTLQTNGVLFTREAWARLEKLHGNFRGIAVSVDAATPETYAYIRRGGNWNKLLENLRFMCELLAESRLRWVTLEYVVQHRNYRELPSAVEMARAFGASAVTLSLITDWGTHSPEEFAEHAIWKTSHPEFEQFLEVLRHPLLSDPLVRIGNLAPYREQALGNRTA